MPVGIGHPTGWKKGYDGSAVRFQPPMITSRLKYRSRAVEMDQCIVLPPFFSHTVSACHDCIQCCITFSLGVSNWRRTHLDSSRGKVLVLVSGRLLSMFTPLGCPLPVCVVVRVTGASMMCACPLRYVTETWSWFQSHLVVIGFKSEKSNSQVIRGVSCAVVLLRIMLRKFRGGGEVSPMRACCGSEAVPEYCVGSSSSSSDSTIVSPARRLWSRMSCRIDGPFSFDDTRMSPLR